ncbi:vWA domain-containing protein [Desulfopila aestuarii]|uniref:Ca-activated chloride channel family protein n=1 Tax=Desulfopila aestuarii DSM 18488 TaxID=1121416 RepID=A0A1M7Y7K4_9BACT|nr:VWA domain-containing protein [Desulfopila aestuarii]SHO48613.1 Ca-activated chloride channel family protein [Desulfopila aestuarii DSM 18488]
MRFRVWLKFLSVMVLLLPVSALCAEKPRVMLILDSSGSMWGQIDGKAKIEIAREALGEIIDTIPAEYETGLMAYGHRRKGDCQDIETLVDFGPHSPAAMKKRIAEISPKGKTPLSASVQMAAKTLRSTEEKATVILLTDGLETCDADPCQVAADLARSGVDFTVHVVGFDLSEGDQGRLRCLADKTGGLFVAAGDAKALKTALATTVEKVKAPPPPVVEKPGTATLNGPAQVTVGETFSVNWQGPNSRNDFICLASRDQKKQDCCDYIYTEQGNPVQLAAKCEAGDYELRYIHGYSDTIISREDIAVVPAQVELQIPAAVKAATPVEVTWRGPGYPTDYISIAEGDQPGHSYLNYTYTSTGSPLKVQAPSIPGTYEVRYVLGQGDTMLARKSLTVEPVTATVTAPQTVDAAASFTTQWQGPNNDRDYISIAVPAEDGSNYATYAYTSNGNPVTLTAPSAPGTYEVRYVLGQDDVILARQSLEVKGAGAQIEVPATVNIASGFNVQWQGPNNERDYISIASPGDAGSTYLTYSYTNTGNPVKLVAPSAPGTYEVRYILGQDDVILSRQPLEVKDVGAQIQTAASIPAGNTIEVNWQGPNNDGDYISLARADQGSADYLYYQYTTAGSPVTLKLPVIPGNYEVRYILGQDNRLLAKQVVELTPITAGVQGPASAPAGTEIEVSWQGPNAEMDYISIARPGEDGSSYAQYEYTNAGNPVKVMTPEEPGEYEIRYIFGDGDTIMARTGLKIE